MKRYFVLLIALFLLTGCSSKVETVPETTMQQETQPDPGWYIPNSEVERSTGGAVRAFDLPGENALWVGGIGKNLLLALDGESI